MNLKKRFLIISCILVILGGRQFGYLFSTSGDFSENLIEEDQIKKNKLETSSSQQPLGTPLEVSQYATVSKAYYPQLLPKNISFTLAKGWTSHNVSIYYDEVSHKDDYVSNGRFTDTISPWNYIENVHDDQQFYNLFGDWNDYGRIQVHNVYQYAGDSAYYEQSITIDEKFTEDKLLAYSLDCMYENHDDTTFDDNMDFYFAVIVGGVEKNYTIQSTELTPGTWETLSLIYNPIEEGQNLPDAITFRAGVAIKTDGTPQQDLYFRIDNVRSEIWTGLSDSDILYAYDYDLDTNFTYTSTGSGTGKTIIDTERYAPETEEFTISILKNSSFTTDFNIGKITLESDLSKNINSSFNSQVGSKYNPGEFITWNTEIPFSIPPSYSDNWAAIDKPIEWKMIHIFDGYEEERINDCEDTGSGNSTFRIPIGVLEGGLWDFEAISTNMMKNTEIFETSSGGFIKRSKFSHGDRYMINTTLNESIELSNTEINFSINYPNGSLFYNESKEPLSHNVRFGNLTIGTNMTVGEYNLEIIWTDNKTDLNRSRVAYWAGSFEIWHNTSLKPVESYITVKAGDPLLLKVNYTDIALNDSVSYGTVTYNSTFGQQGSMGYQGSGIYSVDLDTSSLSLGDYYISVNASKQYYQRQSIKDIIHLEIVSQPLELEVPGKVIKAMGNSYVTIDINVTGADTGKLVEDANVSTDWEKMNGITSYGDGTFALNISTQDLPESGVRETYVITIYANKTHYGSTTETIFLEISPIPSKLTLNQTSGYAYIDDFIYVNISYTINETGKVIENANWNVNWDASHNIINESTDPILNLSTIGLNTETYTATLQASKEGYQTISNLITVNVIPIPTKLTLNESVIETEINNKIIIEMEYITDGKKEVISGANIEIDWDGSNNIVYKNGKYLLILSTEGLSLGTHTLILKTSKEGYETGVQSVYVVIEPSKTNLKILNEQPMEFIMGDIVYLKCQYLINGENYDKGSVSLIGSIEGSFKLNGSMYIYSINTTELEIKSYAVQILANGTNIETQLIDLLFKIVPLELELDLEESSVVMQEGGDNGLRFTIHDSSHNLTINNFTVRFSIQNRTYRLNPSSDGTYYIDLDELDLRPSVNPYHLRIYIENPFGEDLETTVTVSVPLKGVNELNTLIFIVSSTLVIGGISIYVLNKKYLSLSEFQRKIRKQKKNIMNGKFLKILNKTRDDQIQEIFEGSIPLEIIKLEKKKKDKK